MIVECEKCKSKFNFDQALIKEEGSKVRCSRCKNIFIVYPPQPESEEDQTLIQNIEEELEETVALDSPPAFTQEGEEGFLPDDKAPSDFDQAFHQAIEQAEGFDEEEEVEPFAEEVPEIEETPILAEKGKKGPTEGGEKKKGKKEKAKKKAKDISPEKKTDRSSKRLLIILLVVFFLIIFLGVVYFFLPHYLPGFLSSQKPVPAETLTDKGVKNLSFKAVSGSFVPSEAAGPRFVIKGKITNNYPDPRSYILIKAEMLDEKGNVIQRKLSYSGNVFTENEIKEMPMTEIDQILKNRMGRNKMNVNIGPEADVPFMVIFENLPQNLSEFSVEAISSSSGE